MFDDISAKHSDAIVSWCAGVRVDEGIDCLGEFIRVQKLFQLRATHVFSDAPSFSCSCVGTQLKFEIS